MKTLKTTELVALANVKIALDERGVPCTIEYPGYLAVADKRLSVTLNFGGINETWSGDVMRDGDVLDFTAYNEALIDENTDFGEVA